MYKWSKQRTVSKSNHPRTLVHSVHRVHIVLIIVCLFVSCCFQETILYATVCMIVAYFSFSFVYCLDILFIFCLYCIFLFEYIVYCLSFVSWCIVLLSANIVLIVKTLLVLFDLGSSQMALQQAASCIRSEPVLAAKYSPKLCH